MNRQWLVDSRRRRCRFRSSRHTTFARPIDSRVSSRAIQLAVVRRGDDNGSLAVGALNPAANPTAVPASQPRGAVRTTEFVDLHALHSRGSRTVRSSLGGTDLEYLDTALIRKLLCRDDDLFLILVDGDDHPLVGCVAEAALDDLMNRRRRGNHAEVKRL